MCILLSAHSPLGSLGIPALGQGGTDLFFVVGISGELWLDEFSDLGSWDMWPLSGVFWGPAVLSL